MFAAVPMTAVRPAGRSTSAHDAVVVRLQAAFGDDAMPIVVRRALAALVIDQPAHVIDHPPWRADVLST